MSQSAIMEDRQYLTFMLGDEVFAMDIDSVREVLEFTSVTRVPRVPEYMRGVINLRGNVVPVLDLRLKLGMTKTENSVNTCVIITEVTVEGELVVLGALADSVREVMDIEAASIEAVPKIGTKLNTAFLKGMGKRGNEFVMILDLDRVFNADEAALVRDMGFAEAEPPAKTAPPETAMAETAMARQGVMAAV
ncbi:MAG: chemotaxis protein CheW [Nitrospirae bacterium]|nr:chemotaxis protein CheW [Nitrospirota bacterium]